MWRFLIVVMALTLAAPGLAWASHCVWAIDPGAGGDVISVMNQGADADNVTFRIFDNAGAQRGGDVDTGSIASNGRYETKVADLYTLAGLKGADIKGTWIQAREGLNNEMALQVKTGGGSFQPLSFDSSFSEVPCQAAD